MERVSLFLRMFFIFLTFIVNVYAMEQNQYIDLSSQNLQNQVEEILATKNLSSIKADSFITMASTCDDQDDAQKLLELAGKYKSFGNIEVTQWLPGGGILTDVAIARGFQGELSKAIRDNNFKKIAAVLGRSKRQKIFQEPLVLGRSKRQKIFQEHLVLAISLKKEKMARALIALGADIDTPIVDGFQEVTLAEYAKNKDMPTLEDFIKKRMESVSEQQSEPLFSGCCASLMAKLGDIIDLFE